MNAPPVVEESISAAELGSIPKAPKEADTSGLDAAKAALGSTEETDSESLVNVEANGVIELAEMLLGIACLVAARGEKRKKLGEASKFTSGERGMLGIFAPSVAPHVGPLASRSPEVAIAGFLGCLCVIAWGRVRDLREVDAKTKPKPASSSSTSSSDDPSVIPSEVLAHKRLWGEASDAVPPGTKIRDVGLPEKWDPKKGGR